MAKILFTSFIYIVMKIENQYSPVFGAKLINNHVNVGKLQQGATRYCNSEVSFVEIEPDNVNDIKALKNCSEYWSYAKFSDNIYHAACAARNESKYYENNKVYALTSQTDSFEKLDDDKILGLVHVSPIEQNSLFIEHLQVKPDIIFVNKPEYKGVGTGILDSLKELTNKITLFPTKDKSVRDFYERNGFFEFPPGSNIFTWVKEIFPSF